MKICHQEQTDSEDEVDIMGEAKAGRGAGKRGGRGNAGMNKHRLLTRLKYMPGHWGMHGFNRDPSLRTVHNSINVSEVDLLMGMKIQLI